MGLELDEPFLTRSIVTIPENYTEMTASLVASLVINSKKRIGKQAEVLRQRAAGSRLQ